MSHAAKRYTLEMTGVFIFYTATIFFTGWAARHVEMAQGVRVAVALLPMIPTAFVFVVMLRFFHRMDELQQRTMGEAAIIAAIVVGFASFAYGLMVSYAGLPEIPMVWVLPALIGVQGAALPFVKRRYR